MTQIKFEGPQSTHSSIFEFITFYVLFVYFRRGLSNRVVPGVYYY
jgi:hypothetical protein